MPNRFWLSFADPKKAPGHQFLGVAIVTADDFHEALLESRRTGCNPGGEVKGFDIGDAHVPSSMVGRLLSKDEAQTIRTLGSLQ